MVHTYVDQWKAFEDWPSVLHSKKLSTSKAMYKGNQSTSKDLEYICIVQQFECLAEIKPPVQIEKPTLKAAEDIHSSGVLLQQTQSIYGAFKAIFISCNCNVMLLKFTCS